jgi:G3E family GTPase
MKAWTFSPPERTERIPVTLVTGFLGSGKTTLVNHILSNSEGLKAAVLVNELGEIGIDNELIVTADGGMIELSNGCICCSTNNDLVESIVRVLSRNDPVERILVETTGVADPLAVAQTFQRPEFRSILRLDGIIALADAEQPSLDLHPESVAARQQIRHADTILVNKCDRVDESRCAAVEQALRALNPEAKLVRTTRSAVPLPLVLEIDAIEAEIVGHGHRHTHLQDDGFVALAFESDRPFSTARFQAFLNDRPPGLFRGKGFLRLVETEQRYIFHLVGGRFTLEVDRRASGTNRLVLIGRQLDRRDLHARLTACLSGSSDGVLPSDLDQPPSRQQPT